MRPIELTIVGFGPFRDSVTIDFTDANFFALVGPTGAGKSSVIDAICYALYGSVPRYAQEGFGSPAVTTGVEQATIKLTFDAGGKRYTALRVFVRNEKSGFRTKEIRLEQVAPTSMVLAGDVKSFDAELGKVLGLPFAHFTRAVVLPQGEFAKFLHDTDRDRQNLLVELLGLQVYERMMRDANAQATKASTEADGLKGQLAELAGANDQAMGQAAENLARLASLKDDIAAAGPLVASAQAGMERAERDLESRRGLLRALERITIPDSVTRREEMIDSADQVLTAAKASSEAAEAAAQRAESNASSAADIGLLSEQISARKLLANHMRRLESANAENAALSADAETAEGERVESQHRFDAADAAVRAAEHTHAAYALATGLIVGKPCPVCLMPILTIPEHTAPADLQTATSLRKQAQAQLTATKEAASTALQKSFAAAGAVMDLQESCREQQQKLSGVPPQYELESSRTQARELHKVARERRSAAKDSLLKLKTATDTINELLAEQDQEAFAFTSQRDGVALLSPPAPTGKLATDWSNLAAWATLQLEAVTREEEKLIRARDHHATRRDRTILELVVRGQEAGLELADGSTYQELFLSVERAHTEVQSRLNSIRSDAEKRRKLLARQRGLREQADVARDLGKLLDAKGFKAWIIAEALDELVSGASHTLRELSQGAYSLDLNEARNFVVIDHREADATRLARTLSGGETFQASLALALSLADHLGQLAAGGAAKLESIFLDEGFGTLDEDSLEVVAATLETLASGSRIVGVVTHVKELANRVPVRFEVSRRGRTAVVERSNQ